jgi:hypothetical protein
VLAFHEAEGFHYDAVFLRRAKYDAADLNPSVRNPAKSFVDLEVDLLKYGE